MKCILDIDKDKLPDKSIRLRKTRTSKSAVKEDGNRLRRRETTFSFAKAIQNLNEATAKENDTELCYFAHI